MLLDYFTFAGPDYTIITWEEWRIFCTYGAIFVLHVVPKYLWSFIVSWQLFWNQQDKCVIFTVTDHELWINVWSFKVYIIRERLIFYPRGLSGDDITLILPVFNHRHDKAPDIEWELTLLVSVFFKLWSESFYFSLFTVKRHTVFSEILQTINWVSMTFWDQSFRVNFLRFELQRILNAHVNLSSKFLPQIIISDLLAVLFSFLEPDLLSLRAGITIVNHKSIVTIVFGKSPEFSDGFVWSVIPKFILPSRGLFHTIPVARANVAILSLDPNIPDEIVNFLNSGCCHLCK